MQKSLQSFDWFAVSPFFGCVTPHVGFRPNAIFSCEALGQFAGKAPQSRTVTWLISLLGSTGLMIGFVTKTQIYSWMGEKPQKWGGPSPTVVWVTPLAACNHGCRCCCRLLDRILGPQRRKRSIRTLFVSQNSKLWKLHFCWICIYIIIYIYTDTFSHSSPCHCAFANWKVFILVSPLPPVHCDDLGPPHEPPGGSHAKSGIILSDLNQEDM
jgi:hypothetical protein